MKNSEISDLYVVISKVLDADGPYGIKNPYGIAIYFCLIFFSKTGEPFPSIEVMGKQCGMSHPTVNKALEILEKKKLVKVIRIDQKGKKRTKSGNLYQINDISNE